jgi:hypothetical protein
MRSWTAEAPIVSVLKLGATERTIVELFSALRRAREIIDMLGDSGVATTFTGDLGASSKPVSVLRQENGTRLNVRLANNRNAEFTLTPRVRLLTASVEPAREPPAAKTLALISVFEHHLGVILRGDALDRIGAAPWLERLAAIEALLRTSGRAQEAGSNPHVELPTPWSPLRTQDLHRHGRPGPDILTQAERRAWSTPPVVAVPILETVETVFTTIGPVRTTVGLEGSEDPMADLRLIASLPPIGRRTAP